MTNTFQSSPGPKTGRNVGDVVAGEFNPVFQSSPGPKTGRNDITNRGHCGSSRSFNPRPARRPGATHLLPELPDTLTGVSILARPEDRAQQRSVKLTDSKPIKFQSSPGPKTGRNRARRTGSPSERDSAGFNP